MQPRILFRGIVHPARPPRAAALGSALALLAGSLAITGCGGTPGLCTATPLTGGGNQQAGPPPGGSGPAALGTPAGLSPGASGQASRWAQLAARRGAAPVITLPTGERVRLGLLPGGGMAPTPLPPAGAPAAVSAGFVHLSMGADYYLIPYEAVPYLGSLLDPRLFDVSYLARAGLGAAVPVQITYAGGPAPSLPGIPVTHASNGTADATVNASQAARLGRLLASRWQAGEAGLPGVARISLAQHPGAPALPPGLPVAPPGRGHDGPRYHTLTLRFTGMNGKPAAAVGLAQNVDDARLGTFVIPPVFPGGTLPITGNQGPLRFSVPDGTYSLLFSILTPHPGTGLGADAALVAKPQVAVASDTTVTIDARSTTPYRAQVAPPVSASVRVDQMDVWRGSVTGGACGGPVVAVGMGLFSYSGAYGDTATRIRVSPVPPVTKGSFHFEASTYLDPYPGTTTRAEPRYFLDFPDANGVPASLRYTVSRRDLTAVHEQGYAEPPGIYGGSRSPAPGEQLDVYPVIYHPWGDWVSLGAAGMYDNVAPGDRTDYWYTSDPRLTVWQNTFLSGQTCPTACAAALGVSGPHVTIRPGQQITETLGKWPAAPSPTVLYLQANTVIDNPFSHFESYPPRLSVPAASRQDDNGVLELQLGDSAPADQAQQLAGTPRVSFYTNGRLTVPAGLPGDATTPADYYLPLLPRAATYRLDWVQSEMPGKKAAITTGWTFRSGPDAPPASLSRTEQCPVDPARPCSFLPLLFIGYDLPLNFYSQATAGRPFKITFAVEHQAAEPAPSGVSATVSASFNDGKTWTTPRPAAGLGRDRFALVISQPPITQTTGFVSLRVTAGDAAGNSVTQTIIRAYGLTG